MSFDGFLGKGLFNMLNPLTNRKKISTFITIWRWNIMAISNADPLSNENGIEPSRDERSLTQMKRLLCALICSGSINILLLCYLGYTCFKESPSAPCSELQPTQKQQHLGYESSNADCLVLYKNMTLRQLMSKLQNTQLVEDGYTQRDLSLGILVTFHHFDLNRALHINSQTVQQRQLLFPPSDGQSVEEVTVFPGITSTQWKSISTFAQTERWPLTSQGLFLRLKQVQSDQPDLSLLDAFLLTPECQAVNQVLTHTSEIDLNSKEVLKMLIEGDWETLSHFSLQQRISQDLSSSRRQRLLMDYIACHSETAADLILRTDPLYALKKLDDDHAIHILTLLNSKTAESEWFAQELLASPRSDRVWEAAATKLYKYSNVEMPQPYDHMLALARFINKEDLEKKLEDLAITGEGSEVKTKKTTIALAEKKADPETKIHLVQRGDSLWKISRKYKVSIEQLKKVNRLKTDFLQPGIALVIPEKAQSTGS
jgi:LysM repeat protein